MSLRRRYEKKKQLASTPLDGGRVLYTDDNGIRREVIPNYEFKASDVSGSISKPEDLHESLVNYIQKALSAVNIEPQVKGTKNTTKFILGRGCEIVLQSFKFKYADAPKNKYFDGLDYVDEYASDNDPIFDANPWLKKKQGLPSDTCAVYGISFYIDGKFQSKIHPEGNVKIILAWSSEQSSANSRIGKYIVYSASFLDAIKKFAERASDPVLDMNLYTTITDELVKRLSRESVEIKRSGDTSFKGIYKITDYEYIPSRDDWYFDSPETLRKSDPNFDTPIDVTIVAAIYFSANDRDGGTLTAYLQSTGSDGKAFKLGRSYEKVSVEEKIKSLEDVTSGDWRDWLEQLSDRADRGNYTPKPANVSSRFD